MSRRPTGSRFRVQAALGTAAVLLLAGTGCAGEAESAEGGMGLPVVGWLDEPTTGGTAISGTMRVADNGCFHLESDSAHLFILWPDGFEHDGAQVLTGDGAAIADGDELSGTGTVLANSDAVEAGGGKDSQLGQAVGYCAEGLDVVVLTEVTSG
ncbi:hypothetical protein ACFFGH_28505 [Lysobacter korlensis]|uniref:DUF5666 domain-containing protein n=1 Tax=Lysobacter korlensis TaxID=553636 RepID=A0ABV6RZ98_9GAMM